ncbi:hypothetical protein LTR16_011996, partial [Cryomyces antarcticus]
PRLRPLRRPPHPARQHAAQHSDQRAGRVADVLPLGPDEHGPDHRRQERLARRRVCGGSEALDGRAAEWDRGGWEESRRRL